MRIIASLLAVFSLSLIGFAAPARAAAERVYVLLNNTSPEAAAIELIGSDKVLEEFELQPGRTDQRFVTLSSPVRVRLFPKSASAKTVTDTVTIPGKGTTLMIYVHKDCRLQVNTSQK